MGAAHSAAPGRSRNALFRSFSNGLSAANLHFFVQPFGYPEAADRILALPIQKKVNRNAHFNCYNAESKKGGQRAALL
jgi:hypothetical protein